MHKPSDYAHGFGEQAPSHWDDAPLFDGEPVEEEAPSEPMALATRMAMTAARKIALYEAVRKAVSALVSRRSLPKAQTRTVPTTTPLGVVIGAVAMESASVGA